MATTRTIRACALLAVLCAFSCSSRLQPPPPPGAAIDLLPGKLVPPELDLALRVDLSRMKAALGEREMMRLTSEAAFHDLGKGSALGRALPKARVLWIGLRPGLEPALTDNVVVLQGSFRDFDPRRVGRGKVWSPPRLLPDGFVVYERSALGARSEPARIYLRGDTVLVFASVATLDSTQRIIELSRDDSDLNVPELGVLSFAARVPTLQALVRERAPRAERLLSDVEALSGYADLSAQTISLKLRMVFKSPVRAQRTADAVKLLVSALEADRSLTRLLRALRVEVVGSSLWVYASMTHDDFRAAWACLQNSGNCTP